MDGVYAAGGDEDQLPAARLDGPAVPIAEDLLHREAGGGQRPGQLLLIAEAQLGRGYQLSPSGKR